jgi:glycosyltransferase
MKISIITAVYNNADEISIAINSVLSQTYKEIEYIIVDGASTDGTINVIKSFGNQITTFISEPDKGIYDALNKGLSLATGDVIGVLHSDDVFNNSRVIEVIAQRFNNEGCDATYGDLEYVSKTDVTNVIRYWKSCPFDVKNFRRGWMPAHPTLFMRKKIYDEYGMFDTRYKISSDYDLILRTLASGNLKCLYIPMVITRMKLGGASNKSIPNLWKKSYEDWLALRRNKKGGLLVLFLKNSSKLHQFIRKRGSSKAFVA